MKTLTSEGTVVALTLCSAQDEAGNDQKISGLYRLVEYNPVEPSNYVHSAYWLVESVDTTEMFGVDAWDLWEQIDPQGYGRFLAQEREADFAAENDWR